MESKVSTICTCLIWVTVILGMTTCSVASDYKEYKLAEVQQSKESPCVLQ